METSNNGHQLLVEESINRPDQSSYQMRLEDGYSELSLNHPSIGQVMQLTPLVSSFVSFNNSLVIT